MVAGDSKKVWKVIREVVEKKKILERPDVILIGNTELKIDREPTEIINAFNDHYVKVGENLAAMLPHKLLQPGFTYKNKLNMQSQEGLLAFTNIDEKQLISL